MDQISELVTRLGRELRACNTKVTADTRRRLRDEVPDYYAIDFAEYTCVHEVLEFVCLGFVGGGPCPEDLPPHLVEEAIGAARNNVAWEVISRGYHISHEVIWDAVTAEIDDWALARSEQKRLLQTASRAMFRYFDFMCTTAGRLYERERISGLYRPQQPTVAIVKQVLDGVRVPDSRLGYSTDAHHLAIIAWGHRPDVAVRAAAQTWNTPVLAVPAEGRSVWSWITLAGDGRHAQFVKSLQPEAGSYLALGSIQYGRAGFVASHQQASLARSIRLRGFLPADQRVISYPDVAVEAVGLADEGRARAFVAYVLGPLAAGDSRNIKLRETLQAYFDSGNNATAAARALGLAERTVRYRVRTAEEQLGGFGPGRVQQIALAVRLLRALEHQATNRLVPLRGRPDEAASYADKDA